MSTLAKIQIMLFESSNNLSFKIIFWVQYKLSFIDRICGIMLVTTKYFDFNNFIRCFLKKKNRVMGERRKMGPVLGKF